MLPPVLGRSLYPKIVIQRSSEDICDECFVFANQHRYGKRKKENDDDDEDGLLELVSKLALDDDDDDDDVNEMEMSEERVLAAAKHVDRAKKQRELFNLKKQEAKDDKDTPRGERSSCFVADFAQNMNVPIFLQNNLASLTTTHP